MKVVMQPVMQLQSAFNLSPFFTPDRTEDIHDIITLAPAAIIVIYCLIKTAILENMQDNMSMYEDILFNCCVIIYV